MDGPANTLGNATNQSEHATRFRSPVPLDHRDGMRRTAPPIDPRIQCNYRWGIDNSKVIGTRTNFHKHWKVLRHFQLVTGEIILTTCYLPDNRDFRV
jgi:hypothetical protein